ncbi:MAG: phosphoribosylglycinamide formyltransferase [Pseudomonadota bacterium]
MSDAPRQSPDRRRRAAILISGRGTNMTALLDAMAAPDYPAEAALVLSNRPDAAGLDIAAARGVATSAVASRPFKGDRAAFEDALQKTLTAHDIDIICLAGFMRILTGGFVDAWKDRMINIHPSLIPAFKGLDTHQRALDAGVVFHGCTVHLVRAEMDDGPILGQAALTIQSGEAAEALAERVLKLEHQLYPAALAGYLSGAMRVEGDAITPGPMALPPAA